MSHLILVDGNNLGFAGMANPRLSAGEANTQSTFTVIKKIRRLFMDNSDALIMVLWDGRSWRKDCFSEYKANRERTEKQIEDRKQYYEQKSSTLVALRLLGVTQCSAINMEADDLAEIYSRTWGGEKVTLISGDKDWLQLVNKRTTWVDPIHDRQCTHLNFEAFTGCKDVKQFLERKYIQGDVGDNIKGYNGLGEKTLDKLYEICDSVSTFMLDSGPLHNKWEKVHNQKLPKVLREINCDEMIDILSKNETLMNLRTISRPEPINLRRVAEPLQEEAFKNFCYENAFLSFLKDYDRFLQPFKGNKFVRV